MKLPPISLSLFLPNGHRNAPSAVGQHLSHGYHRPQKRDSLPTADQADQHLLGVVHGSTGGGRSSTRHLQHAGRPSVPSFDEQMQLQIIMCLWGPWRWTGLRGACGLNCPFSACWKPDPKLWATDAFSQDWTQYQGYANLPAWCLVNRCLQQAEYEDAELVMVMPAWSSQPW